MRSKGGPLSVRVALLGGGAAWVESVIVLSWLESSTREAARGCVADGCPMVDSSFLQALKRSIRANVAMRRTDMDMNDEFS